MFGSSDWMVIPSSQAMRQVCLVHQIEWLYHQARQGLYIIILNGYTIKPGNNSWALSVHDQHCPDMLPCIFQLFVSCSVSIWIMCYIFVLFQFHHPPSVTWTRVRVSVSGSGAGVRFVRIFGDTANNTWNSTQVSESDTGAGYLDSAKKLRHGCPGNTVPPPPTHTHTWVSKSCWLPNG